MKIFLDAIGYWIRGVVAAMATHRMSEIRGSRRHSDQLEYRRLYFGVYMKLLYGDVSS